MSRLAFQDRAADRRSGDRVGVEASGVYDPVVGRTVTLNYEAIEAMVVIDVDAREVVFSQPTLARCRGDDSADRTSE